MTGELGRALATCRSGNGRPDPEPRVGGAFLSGHAGAGGQRLLRGGLPGGDPGGHRRRAGGRRVPAALGRRALGHLIRSTDPVVVETVRTQYPELVPYLAPVATPTVAEARYLRARYGGGAAGRVRGHVAAAIVSRGGRGGDLLGPGAAPPRMRGVSAADAADVLPADSRGAAAPPERGGRAAPRAARGGAAGEPAGSGSFAGSTRCRRSPGR